MSQRDAFEIDLDVGEDFAAQIFWTDEDNNPVPVTEPCRADVRDTAGNLILQFATENFASTETKPAISITGSQGFLQLSCPKLITRSLVEGRYTFDLFATVVGNTPFAEQQQKLLAGWFNIQPRVTIMEVASA